jgi:ribosome-binding protein aMBF1 (putative translation factor)
MGRSGLLSFDLIKFYHTIPQLSNKFLSGVSMVQRDRLLALRTQKGLSQEGLGKRVGKPGSYISKLERGVLTSTTTTTLEKLADALGCSTDYLLGREDSSE